MRAVVVWGIIGLLCLGYEGLFAQISQGGRPIEPAFLKSSRSGLKWYKTPFFRKETYLKQDNSSGNSLKPLRFAHSFDVSLNPENSGSWTSQENYKIWLLGIESTGAYSINLIFKNFRLPPKARLFIYNADRSDIIGAFTDENNSASGMFPTLPVAGDKIIVQYEEPVDPEFHGTFEIASISHDFLGIGLRSSDPRRPLNIAADYCNVDINCQEGIDYENAKNSVCRIFINGNELCSGVLLNNTSNNGKPYVLTAAHCIENGSQAHGSLFLFNYESPYCGSIDGDNTHSLAGCSLKARYDSLDFSLVELSVAPPDYFRPYYAGWDVSGIVPSRSFSVHHPQGDIKKIAIDENQPATATYNKDYISSSFWKVSRWEYGVTEAGSSGGPLFDGKLRVIGTLTGGAASCSDPRNDYYEKLNRSWNYKSSSDKQLKYWLDPVNTGETKINGYEPYSGELKCGAYTNFTISDTTQLKRITEAVPSNGYLTGTNKAGYTEFAEKFSMINNANLHGISIGIAKKHVADNNRNVLIDVKVYEGYDLPVKILHSQSFVINQLTAGAMNYLAFNKQVSTIGNFFISCAIDQLNPGDTLALYQAKRTTADNSLFLKNADGWKDYKTVTGSANGSSLLMELVACNIDKSYSSPIVKNKTNEIVVFPNPLNSGEKLTVHLSSQTENSQNMRIYNLLGQEIPFQIISGSTSSMQLQLRDARMGIYLLQLESEGKKYSVKFSVVP
ncbi:MAG: T9SS type A sorting domain-containing protein [Prolixibacteraceae bacterium]|jgi:hypothetical protein|nr:T9SS type A sorting domain-containing protein [Prolixibacteraceae bacterium]